MHLSAAAPREAIRALEVGGELGETTPQLERRFNKYNA
jgi:hypothetical protein